MRRAASAFGLGLCLATAAWAETAADRFAPSRGMNIEIWTDWLTTEEMVTRPGFLDLYPDWRRTLTVDHPASLRKHGFDFVRVPFDPAPLLRLGPGPAQDALIDQIFDTTVFIQAAGLKVIVDLHSVPREDEEWGTDSLVGDPALFDAHVALVGRVAARLTGLDPDRTALEVLNEPTNDCPAIWEGEGPTLWPDQLARLHAAARTGAPNLPLVLSGACWGGMDGLSQIDPDQIGDDNVIWSFHSYDPFLFTHQSAGWAYGAVRFFADVPYPPDTINDAKSAVLLEAARARRDAAGSPLGDADLAAALAAYRGDGNPVAVDAARAAAWADTHGIPRNRLLLGEFGGMRDDMQGRRFGDLGRDAFLQDKRRSAEAQGIGWSVWGWTQIMGVADDDTTRILDPANCRALGLSDC